MSKVTKTEATKQKQHTQHRIIVNFHPLPIRSIAERLKTSTLADVMLMTFSHIPPLHGGQHTEGLCHTHPNPPFTRWAAQDTSPGEAWVPICVLRMRFLFFPFCLTFPNSLSVVNANIFHRRRHEIQTNGCISHRCNVRLSYVGWDSALPL